MSRCGTSLSHCCWIAGEQCPYVEASARPDFYYDCALRKREPDWDAVHASPEYREIVKPKLEAAGVTVDCGDWPPPGHKCNDCGEIGQ